VTRSTTRRPRIANDDELGCWTSTGFFFRRADDALLMLARDQKVDLRKISILELADQYLAFIARRGACVWRSPPTTFVMALGSLISNPVCYCLSRPPTASLRAPELAAALAFQLQRLEAMQEAAESEALPQFGRDFFAPVVRRSR